MDTRKLTFIHSGTDTASIVARHPDPERPVNNGEEIAALVDPRHACEIARRWNAHDDLLNALKHVHETDAVNIDWKMVANTIEKYTHP